jgi:hypothetical protein
MARVNELIRQVQHERPDLRVIDLARWVSQRPGGELDAALRPDGVHFADDASADIVAPWLARAILRVYEAPPPIPR